MPMTSNKDNVAKNSDKRPLVGDHAIDADHVASYTFDNTTISVRRIRPTNATRIVIDTLDFGWRFNNNNENRNDNEMDSKDLQKNEIMAVDYPDNINACNVADIKLKNGVHHTDGATTTTMMNNFNKFVKPQNKTTKLLPSLHAPQPLTANTTGTNGGSNGYGSNHLTNNSNNTTDQLKDVESVIHRSELYLAHQNQQFSDESPGGRNRNSGVGRYHRSNSGRSSTSSGAYSSSDKLPSVSTGDDPDELSGLPEGNVDSDEEDDDSCPSGDSIMELRDSVRECLEKDPVERTEDDIQVLLDFMQHMPAFANLPVCLKRELCWKMVFAVVEKAYQVVMRDGEPLDSWCVVVNGELEVILSDGSKLEYHLGDSFGVEPRPDVQYHCGQMRTLVDDCQFVLVAQQDYVRILSEVSTNLRQHTDAAGEIVSETERRTFDNNKEGYVLVKGKPDKLLQALIDEKETTFDQFYVEDFLLMYRTFIKNPADVFEKFLYWFTELHLKEKVARLVLLWVNNHFNDFETDSQMMKLLEMFESALEREAMTNHQQLLNIACSVKSRQRTLTYTRSNRDELLHFSILGGQEKCYGIFVSDVERNSQVEKVGLKRGDQILEVNNNNFQHISYQKALEILRGSTHISMIVKSNLLGFKEMLRAADRQDEASTSLIGPGSVASMRHKSTGSKSGSDLLIGKRSRMPTLHHTHSCTDSQLFNVLNYSIPPLPPPPPAVRMKTEKELSRFAKLLKKIKQGHSLTSFTKDDDQSDCDLNFDPDPAYAYGRRLPYPLKHSRSNPDLSLHLVNGLSQYYQPTRAQCPEHVLKIYRSDQTFKYLTVYKETTAHNVVQLALQEFGMAAADASSLEWSLNEVSVTSEGVIRQKRLPDQMQNLAERIALNSRYYLKNNKSTEPLVSDALAPELSKESQTCLLNLNANILAAQLTLQDFAVFASIEPTEFVDNVFELSNSKYGWKKLTIFDELVNREMWWVVNEVCQERNVIRRAKIVKKFIKLARRCRDFRNFNSMFAIMSGLEKPAVRRLHNTWDKISSKYSKMFEDLQLLLDPSRNMSKYRQHLTKTSLCPPVIPLFPVVRKDLYFIHQCNPTWSDGLVNFEKLRMISKEIRSISRLASVPYELSSMFEQSGAGRLNDALLHMNTFEGGASVATMRKQIVNRAPLPRKKLYEQALMVRRCKSYLSSLNIIDNESELDRLSYECEPQLNSGSAQNQNSKRPLPSPSMSSCSSLSLSSDKVRRAPGPKFGVESPQAVQKMLALVDHSRVRPPPLVPRQATTGGGSGATSPCPPPRSQRYNHNNNLQLNSNCHQQHNGRSQSDTVSPLLMPVDLTAESSSVTTLLSTSRMLSSGSVTSTDSTSSQSGVSKLSHAISSDSNDSGHCSVATNDTNSVGSQHSPFCQKRFVFNNNSQCPPIRQARVTASHYANYSNVVIPPPAYSSASANTQRKYQCVFGHTAAVGNGAVVCLPRIVRRTSSIPSASERQSYFDDFDDEFGEQVSRV